MWLGCSFDVGDIVAQESIAIDPHISAVQLTDRLAGMGANLLVRCISDLHYHLDRCIPQPSHGVTLGMLFIVTHGRILQLFCLSSQPRKLMPNCLTSIGLGWMPPRSTIGGGRRVTCSNCKPSSMEPTSNWTPWNRRRRNRFPKCCKI